MAPGARRPRSANNPIVGDVDIKSAVSVPPPVQDKVDEQVDARVQQLEKQLTVVLAERDDLARDVENLCMQSGSSIFDGSMVLSERIFSAEKELSQVKAQLAAVTEERNNLREDLRGHRDSKRTVDNSWRAERERADQLEKELQFYQTQSARAMADRDKAAWEAEELRQDALAMQTRMSRAEGRAETAVAEQREVEEQLSGAWERIRELEVKAKDCETIPGLWRHISEASQTIKEMEVAHDALETSMRIAKTEAQEGKEAQFEAQRRQAAAESELEETRARSHAEVKAATAEVKALKARVAELEEVNLSLELRAEEAEGNLAAAQSETETIGQDRDSTLSALKAEHAERLASMEASHLTELEPLRTEVVSLRERLKSTTAELEQVTGEKVQALMRMSQAEQTAEQAFEETGNLLDQVADLKDRVAQASQEKVAALMQVASLKEQLRGSGSASKTSSALPSRPGQSTWRLWGGGSSGPTSGTLAEAAESEVVVETKGTESTAEGGMLARTIDKVKDLQDRIQHLDRLASSAAALREECAAVVDSLSDTPTHLQRKDLAKKVATLEEKLRKLQSSCCELFPGTTFLSAQTANGTIEHDADGDASAAQEMLNTLALVLDVLRVQVS